ncbi:MAG: PstS family phosphate ABC transporter substrate-binding protein [Planctomycetota bacterium]|nr:PstS family phosphate ABC transporter substrate-binding protein [Planctomycetota bacterium]MDA1252350.1 PstS family phosphate ABC transporter substrate-binding protein [Planctomycetota bacterium]
MKKLAIGFVAVVAGLTLQAAGLAQVKVDEKLPVYKPVQGMSGSLKSVGSDTMNNEMTLWAEGFLRFYPNVKIEIEGKGSSTAPPALISGTSQFGPMSRKMKDAEVAAFEKKYGYKPVALSTSIDMLAIYVNKDNPIKGLNLQQVDAMFSKTRKGGYPNDIRTWGQSGLTGDWAQQPISLYGRNSASGTYGYLKENALFGGDFKNQVKEQPGSSSVVQGIASNKFAIGYSGIGYKTADVLAVPLAVDGDDYVEAIPENAYTGEYPLARFLWLYVNHKPGTELDPLRREFIRYIFSKNGQEDVVKDGYFPVPAAIAKEALKGAGI